MSIVGSRENDGWEIKILGPIGFERPYTWVGRSGEHQPLAIANVLLGKGRTVAGHVCESAARLFRRALT